jgi:hypothetical protein
MSSSQNANEQESGAKRQKLSVTEQDTCVICLEAIDRDTTTDVEVCVLQSCKHMFHTGCIQCALVDTQCCPLCRNEDTRCQHGPDGHCAHILRGENCMLRERIIRVERELQECQDTMLAQMIDREARVGSAEEPWYRASLGNDHELLQLVVGSRGGRIETQEESKEDVPATALSTSPVPILRRATSMSMYPPSLLHAMMMSIMEDTLVE